ncbi:DUF6526 family protein [Algoriphagus aquimarinus]|nr:DUF6526 family protein [Algoriphagus aquimarinus]
MSKTQNFENHAKLYPLHHFIIMPMALIYLGWTVVRTDFSSSTSVAESIYQLLLAFLILLISYLPRIYAIKNQNRIIRLEMRQRYFHLTGSTFYDIEIQLTSAQIIALRFAGDDEILALIDKSIKENTTPKEIKKSIKNWKADHHRV